MLTLSIINHKVIPYLKSRNNYKYLLNFINNKHELVQEFKTEPLGKIVPHRIPNDVDYNRNNKFLRYDLPREWYSRNLLPSIRRSRIVTFISECAKIRGATPMLISRIIDGPLKPKELCHFTSIELSRIVMAFGIMKSENCLHGDRFRLENALANLIHEAKTRPRLLTYDPKAISQISTGIAMLKLNDKNVLNELVDEFLKPVRLRNSSLETIANMLQAMSLVNYENKEHIEILSNQIKGQLNNMPGFCFPKVIKAWKDLDYKDPEAINELLKEASTGRRLSQFVATNISDIILACAKFQIDESEYLNIIVKDFIISFKWRFMSDKTHAEVILALGELRYKHEGHWHILLNSITQTTRLAALDTEYLLKILRGWSKISFRNHLIFEQLLKALIRESKLAATKTIYLDEILINLINMAIVNDIYLNPLRTELGMKDRIRDLGKEYKLKMILRPMAMQVYREDIIISILDDLFKESNDKNEFLKGLDTFTLIKLINSFEDFGKEYLCYFSYIMKELVSISDSNNRLDSLKNSHILKIFFSWTKLGYRDENVINAFGKCLIEENRLINYNETELVAFTWTLGHLGCHDFSIYDKFNDEIIKKNLGVFTGKSISMILSAWAMIGYKNEKTMKILVDEMKKEKKIDEMKLTHLKTLIWSLEKLSYPDDLIFFNEKLENKRQEV